MDNTKKLVAERILFLSGEPEKKIMVRIYAPIFNDENQAYSCEYSYVGITEETLEKQAYGADSVQALVLALQHIGVELEHYNKKYLNGKLRWLDESVKDMEHFGFLFPPGLT